jgi:hypothetical protein
MAPAVVPTSIASDPWVSGGWRSADVSRARRALISSTAEARLAPS